MDAYKSMPQFNEALKSFGSMGINTDSLGNMFNGDILMSLESISNMGFPVFSIIAEVPNNSFMETIFTVTKVFGISFTEVSPGLYTFQNTFYLYSKDGIFIVTSNKAVIDNIDKGFSPSLANAPYAKIYKGTYGAMYIDFKALLAIPMLGADKNPYYKFVSSITDITMTSPKKTESEIFVNFENKDVNALQQILFK